MCQSSVCLVKIELLSLKVRHVVVYITEIANKYWHIDQVFIAILNKKLKKDIRIKG
jgi:hypothetical protein